MDDYKALLARHRVRPGKMELWVADADGSNARQITYLNAASFAPFFFPDGKRVIFASNYDAPNKREFEIWAVNVDGTGLRRITYSRKFDGFPMFSPDGRYLAFASNRNNRKHGETNVFIARWVKKPAAAEGGTPAIGTDLSPDRIARDIRWLADPARKGRDVGSKGLEAAAAWAERRFKEVGVAPAMPGGKYRHTVTVPVAVKVGENTSLAIDGRVISRKAFVPTGFSASGKVHARVVPVGYGVVAKKAGINDYAKVNVRGKIAVARRFLPKMAKFPSEHAKAKAGSLREKAMRARDAGARALIIVDLPRVRPGQKMEPDAPLPKPRPEVYGNVGIPVIVLRRAEGAALFKGRSRKVRLQVSVRRVDRPGANVVGVIKAGADVRHKGVVLIAAHLDHLGMGGPDSRAPGKHAVHPGADDNASGVAVVLEVARTLAAQRTRLSRDVAFAFFTAEERGALGSNAFVRKPPPGLAPKKLVAMLDLDMVGRLRKNRLTVIGTRTAKEWPDLVGAACESARVGCKLGGTGVGPSDHTAFFLAKVPVLHFFTGVHSQYHTPKDTADRINAVGAARVARIVAALTLRVASRPDRLTYVAAPRPPPKGDQRGGGASLGTVPDFGGPPPGQSGVLLSGTVPGSPAAKAGLKRGDILVELAGRKIRNLHDFAHVLRSVRPGQKAKAVVLRKGKRTEIPVTFGVRRRRYGAPHGPSGPRKKPPHGPHGPRKKPH
jgi:hypothetical protein